MWSTTSFDDLAALAVVVDWDDLTDPEGREDFSEGLIVVRREVARFLEALIWSRMYAFSAGDRPGAGYNPPIAGQTGKPPFTTIKPPLQDYWRDRFQPDADAYTTTRGQPLGAGPVDAALRLRKYLAAISYAVEKAGIGLGRQTLIVP